MKNSIGRFLNKLGVKAVALSIYFFFSNTFTRIKYFFREIILPLQVNYRKRNGILAVDIRNDFGIGSKLSWCIVILKFCEDNKLTPQFRFSYPEAKDDFFSIFFSLSVPRPEKEPKFTVINLLYELGFSRDYGNDISIDEASYLLAKYFRVQPAIAQEVDHFCEQHFKGRSVLGIHYRGTDKTGEAPAVSYENVKKNITFATDHYIKANCIFLSTDDQQFAEFLGKDMVELPVIIRADYKRSSGGEAVHLSKGLNRIEMNRDAVVNFLLLSRCSLLLKTSSFLSDISKLMNPSLPTVILNRPYDGAIWFPTKQILEDMLFQPVK